MRPVPKFWTTVEGEAVAPQGRRLRLRMWGWSTTSLAEAAAVAADRLGAAAAKVAGGQELAHWAYYPRMPLRELTLAQIISPDEALLAVITRNRYGVDVLNTDHLLIADVDLPQEPASPTWRAPQRSSSGGGWLSRLLGRTPGPEPAPQQPEPVPPAETEALQRIAGFASAHPELGVHTYRTAAGLRVLVTGGDLPPGTPAAEAVLEALASDPIYVRLCSSHLTYRARLTPKPWRVGHRPLTVSWPYAERAEEVQAWLREYAGRSASSVTTRNLSVTGPPPSPEELQVIEWHDRATGASTDLPLA